MENRESEFVLERLFNPNRRAEGTNVPPPIQKGRFRVPLVQGLELLRTQSYQGGTQFTLVWSTPPRFRNQIDHYNVYVKGLYDNSETPQGPWTVQESPGQIKVNARTAVPVTLIVQTVLKNGMVSDLPSSPAVSGYTAAGTFTSGDYPDNTIPGSALEYANEHLILRAKGLSNPAVWEEFFTVTKITDADSPYSLPTTAIILLINASSGNVTVNLPTVSTTQDRIFWLTRTDSSPNTVTLDPDGSDTIMGEADALLPKATSLTITGDEVNNWHVI